MPEKIKQLKNSCFQTLFWQGYTKNHTLVAEQGELYKAKGKYLQELKSNVTGTMQKWKQILRSITVVDVVHSLFSQPSKLPVCKQIFTLGKNQQ